MRRRIAALLAVMSLLAACSGGTDSPADDLATDSPDDGPASEAGPEETEAPAEDAAVVQARAQLTWVLSLLEDPSVLDAATYESRFDATFRDAVPFEQFVATSEQLAAAGPFTVTSVTPGPVGITAEVLAADGTALAVQLTTTADGTIDGLLFQPAEVPTLEDPPTMLEEVPDRLRAVGATAGFVAATVTGVEGTEATVEVLAGAEEDQPVPIGSAFKLYVLQAVAEAVSAGTLAWEDPLTITAEVKSLPSGILQDRQDGSTVTVQEAAELMIAISDNTATDLLLRAVGREAVEQAQHGHHDPALNVPFLTTRELFALKVADPALQDRYLAADTAERRTILDDLAGVDLDAIPVEAFLGDPVRPDELEWFAAPTDLVRILAILLEGARTDPALAPVEAILTANPGLPDAEGRWRTIAFKGGSEPGLITMAWLVEGADGTWQGVAGSVVDPAVAFDPGEAILLLGAARDLLPGG